MLFKTKLHFVSALSIAFLLLLSFSGNHPAGNTGAPGDSICSNCHGGSGGGYDGTIDIAGLPSVVEPGTVYNITMTLNVTQGSPVRGGFQVVSLLDANNNNAGDWFNAGSSSSLVVSGGREYFGHSPARTFGGSSAVSWTVDWVPPSVNDDVTFYAVGVLGNGSGSSGDNVITNTQTITVQSASNLDISFSNVNDVSCFGENDGSALASTSGGSAPYEYEWDNGENGAQANMLSAGQRSVTVTDNDGTTASASVTIGSPSEIQIDPVIDNVTCFGEEDGFVDLLPFGGSGDYSCDWSDGVTDECLRDELTRGLYFVTVTDEDNCSNVFDIEITEPDVLAANLTSMDESNAGNDGSITSNPSGGVAPYQFDWSNGVSEFGQSSTIDGLAGGNYSLTITDQNDCEIMVMVVLGSEACMLDATATITDVACFADSTGVVALNVFNAVDPVTYNWSNGSVNDSLIGVPEGIYSVEITDGTGCQIMLNSLVVGQADELFLNVLDVQNASCADATDGSIIVNVFGGVGDYNLSWSNGLTNDTMIVQGDTIVNIPDTLTNLTTGIYAYTLFDGNQCIINDSIAIVNGDIEDPVLVLQQGTVYLDSMGNAPAATFELVDAGSNDNCGIDSVAFVTPDFTCADIESFDFPVEIFDAAGNSTRGFATINVIDTIGPVIDCSNIIDIETNNCSGIDYPIPTATDNCIVESIELIEGLPSGVPFPSGTTVVTYAAIDDCGNSATCTFNVTVDIDLEIQVTSVTNISCFGESDGSITVDVTGGTPPYMVTSSGGGFEELPAGEYILSVVDANGCNANAIVNLDEPNPLFIDFGIVDTVSCPGESDAMILLDTLPDNLSWEFNGDPDFLSAGQYEVTITDAGSGCTSIAEFAVAEPQELLLTNVMVIDPSCYDAEDCDVLFDFTGGTGAVNVTLDPMGDFCSSGVTVILEDENGCFLEESFVFSIPDSISVSNITITDANESVNDGSIMLDIEGGSGTFTYQWSDENGNTVSTDEDLLDIPGGIYTLEVVDENGCMKSFEFMVGTIVSTIDLDISNQRVKLYPNPVADIINLDFNIDTPKSIELIDIKGKQLLYMSSVQGANQILDMTDIVPGIYLVRINYEEDIVIKRISKI